MTNLTLEQIHKHASVRRYKPDPLPVSVIETIVAAGQRASTSSNLQMYSVVALTDEAKRLRLADLCGDQQHVREAPVFLTWCADLARLDRACEIRGLTQVTGYVENFLVASIDAVLAAQNAALAAESLGLGICYIGWIRNHPLEVIELLRLPRLVFPITGMTVGWPAKEPRLRPRLPLKAILHWDHYDKSGEDDALYEFDKLMMETGIYKGRQIPVPGREGEMADYGWMEHSARRISLAERTDLRQALEAQGFGLK